MLTIHTEARPGFFFALGLALVIAFMSCGLRAAPTKLTTNNASMAAPANPIDLASSTCSDGTALTFMRSDSHCGVTGTLPLAKLPVPWTASPPDCHGTNQFLKFNNTSHLFTCETAGSVGYFPYRRTIFYQPTANFSTTALVANIGFNPHLSGVVANGTCAAVPTGWPAASGTCTPVNSSTTTNVNATQFGWDDNDSGVSGGVPDMAPIITWIWRTPDATTVGRKYWVGMFNSTNVTGSFGAPCSPGPCARGGWTAAMFAFDPAVNATNWMICTADNSNMSCDDTGLAWTASTYIATIDMAAWGTDGSSPVSWQIASQTATVSGTKNTNKPARGVSAANLMGPFCGGLTTDAIHTVTMQCGRMTLVEN